MTAKELATEIANDASLNQVLETNRESFSVIKKYSEEKRANYNSKSIDDINLSLELGLDEDYWASRETKMMDIANYLNDKYSLFNRDESEIKIIFKNIYTVSNGIENIKSNEECQAQFEDDIAEAHANYDSAIFVLCPILAIGSGSNVPGYVTCAAGAVVKAVTEIAEAIDDYNACQMKDK